MSAKHNKAMKTTVATLVGVVLLTTTAWAQNGTQITPGQFNRVNRIANDNAYVRNSQMADFNSRWKMANLHQTGASPLARQLSQMQGAHRQQTLVQQYDRTSAGIDLQTRQLAEKQQLESDRLLYAWQKSYGMTGSGVQQTPQEYEYWNSRANALTYKHNKENLDFGDTSRLQNLNSQGASPQAYDQVYRSNAENNARLDMQHAFTQEGVSLQAQNLANKWREEAQRQRILNPPVATTYAGGHPTHYGGTGGYGYGGGYGGYGYRPGFSAGISARLSGGVSIGLNGVHAGASAGYIAGTTGPGCQSSISSGGWVGGAGVAVGPDCRGGVKTQPYSFSQKFGK